MDGSIPPVGGSNPDLADPAANFRRGHIPGAVFFDLEALSDQASGLPHTLPSPEDFAAGVGALGLRETDEIVVYDTAGLFSAGLVDVADHGGKDRPRAGRRPARLASGGRPA